MCSKKLRASVSMPVPLYSLNECTWAAICDYLNEESCQSFAVAIRCREGHLRLPSSAPAPGVNGAEDGVVRLFI